MKTTIIIVLALSLSGCKSNALFESQRYRNGSEIFEFYSDGFFSRQIRMEGGYVDEYTEGRWRQDGRRILLSSQEKQLNFLSYKVSTGASDGGDRRILINLLPKKDTLLLNDRAVNELMIVDYTLGGRTYKMEADTKLVHTVNQIDSILIRAYPRTALSTRYQILNDTLKTPYIPVRVHNAGIFIIDIQCNPLFFSRTPLPLDTILIINNNRIRCGKVALHRSN